MSKKKYQKPAVFDKNLDSFMPIALGVAGAVGLVVGLVSDFKSSKVNRLAPIKI